MIKKVRIKNWRSHDDSEFTFSEGTNALIGIMGSGKSSVMDAICFALFGTFPSLQSRKLKLDDVIMKKPSERDKLEVELQFQLGSDLFTVTRIVEKGRGTAYSEIRQNEKIIESPNSQRVTEIVEGLLKVNYELFSKAIYSEQNAIDYFLTIPKGQRMKKIDELLMINKFEKARASAISLTNKVLERKIARQSVVEQADVGEMEKALGELKDAVEKISSEKQSLATLLADTSSEKNRVESELRELVSVKQVFDELKMGESRVSSAIEEISNSLAAIGDAIKQADRDEVEQGLADLARDLAALENDLKDRQAMYEKTNYIFSQSKAKIEFLKKDKIEKLEQELQDRQKVEAEIKQLQDRFGDNLDKEAREKRIMFEQAMADVQALRAKIDAIDESIQQLSAIEGNCPVCDSRLTEEKKNLLVAQKQKQIEKLEAKLREVEEHKQQSETMLETVEHAAKKFEQLMMTIRDLEKIRVELDESKKMFAELGEITMQTDKQLQEMRSGIIKMNEELKLGIDKKQKLEIIGMQQRDYGEKKTRLEEFVRKQEDIALRIAEVANKIAGKNIEQQQESLKQLAVSENEYETRIESLAEMEKEKLGRVEEYQTKLGEMKKYKEELQRLDKVIKNLRIFAKALEETQIGLRKEFVEAVNYVMNKLWQTLYPYQDFVGIRLNVDEGDYILQLQDRSGAWVNVEGQVSGGERSIACLTLRISFALVLAPQLPWLVLDEPTANLDTKAIEDLAETLRERIGDFVEQVFLITHDEKLEDAVSGSLYKLEREKEKDGSTKVVQSP